MDKKFGLIGRLTKIPVDRLHFSKMQIGEKFMILNEVDWPAYDALAIFPNFPPQNALNSSDKFYQGYLERGGYEIIGSIFEDSSLLK